MPDPTARSAARSAAPPAARSPARSGAVARRWVARRWPALAGAALAAAVPLGVALAANYPEGVIAGPSTFTGQPFGVRGTSSGLGSYAVKGEGAMGATGVFGHSQNAAGSVSVPGVEGSSNTGPGVSGHGRIGGSFSGTAAPLRLAPAATAGPPTADYHLAGELYVDSQGQLYLCTAPGTPGAWAQVALTPVK
jgi:hypothetical protein